MSNHLHAAIRFHQAGQFAEAEQHYRRAIETGDAGHARNLLGVLYAQTGRAADGVALIGQAIALNKRVPEFHSNLGMVLLEAGDAAGAVAACRRALQLNPTMADALTNLGAALLRLDQAQDAVAPLRRAIKANPGRVETHRNLGLALLRTGQPAEAATSFRDGIALSPHHADCWTGLITALEQAQSADLGPALASAVAHRPADVPLRLKLTAHRLAMGEMAAAEELARQTLALAPAAVEPIVMLANVLTAQSRKSDARRALSDWLGRGDDTPPQALTTLADAFMELGDDALAEQLFRRAIALDAGSGQATLGLGLLMRRLDRAEEARTLLERCARDLPDSALAQAAYGDLLLAMGRPAAALTHVRRAQTLAPNDAGILLTLGNALRDLGEIDEALAALTQAVTVAPARADIHSNLVFTRLFHPDVTLAQVRADHVAWADRHARPVPPPPARRHPGQTWRVGLVSGDFRNHPVGYFTIRALEALAARGVTLIAYANQRVEDALTRRVQAVCVWRPIQGADAQTVAQQVRDDDIDLLIDLTGHIAGNRLDVFALRPATRQATWAGYMATTGLPQMDMIIVDPHHIPAGAEGFYTERVVRMPHSFLCYDPPAFFPAVTPLPALRNGHVTFGCFNIAAKINAGVIACWSRILNRVPGSRLLMKTRGMDELPLQTRILAQFREDGIDAARIDFIGATSPAEHVACKERVDIALDPFPYAGSTTTLESLWMGLPVVTLTGQTFSGRHSTCFLSVLGLRSLMATTVQEYVDIAVRLATNLDEVADLRQRLRPAMAASPLCDADTFADDFIRLMRGA
ncbi:putative O-linked N-acetylglucosamine transferase (SPINDLY family) [Nitrospirillum amazonense]|uniref:protein O-GlcNAc transferase n=1 Tax=Nitrospirillum amazonense TaxID=28077 RepID=A0A560K6X2_9PROT|nr:tetratricopeptide repeat protein [Nitrospirillum amazonense]TWB77574.1 putative O-linked N-acetylglucosamine transferase (SPINDLY family) [Nitrospirillum amazonense]